MLFLLVEAGSAEVHRIAATVARAAELRTCSIAVVATSSAAAASQRAARQRSQPASS